jgi:hypothetical protein
MMTDGGSGDAPKRSAFAFPTDAGADDFLDANNLLAAFGHQSACLLLDVALQLRSSMGGDDNLTAQGAWNDALLPMARASRVHTSYLLLRNFRNGLDAERGCQSPHPRLGPDELSVMHGCLVLLTLYWMDKFAEDSLQIRCVLPAQVPVMRRALLGTLTALRPCAVGCATRETSMTSVSRVCWGGTMATYTWR